MLLRLPESLPYAITLPVAVMLPIHAPRLCVGEEKGVSAEKVRKTTGKRGIQGKGDYSE